MTIFGRKLYTAFSRKMGEKINIGKRVSTNPGAHRRPKGEEGDLAEKDVSS